VGRVDDPAMAPRTVLRDKAPEASLPLVQRVEVLRTAPRVEVKIPISALHVADARAWVRLHPAHWRRSYPPRQVNNLYFDTGSYDGLNGNLAGVGERAKLRLRWYGPCLTSVTHGQLELKRKQGSVGWKEIVMVEGTYDMVATSMPSLLSSLETALHNHAPDWLDAFPVPVLINHYQRAYYETPDGAVRLTLDTELTVYDQRATLHPNLSRRSRLGSVAILELKALMDVEAQRRLSAAVSSFPARVDRFSKYVTGVLSMPDF
jgi:SPX domain protein involved in polyphosphate accumulation